MAELHDALATRVAVWRADGYRHEHYPAIGELLAYAIDGEEPAAPFPQSGQLRFLRAAQLRALETYWYLRLVEGTPRIADLYERMFDRTSERLEALGLAAAAFATLALDLGYTGLLDRIRSDDAFVRQHRLDALRETLTLDYPSYILALAMGAGKTVLVGAIIASEFAMALEYPDGGFIENALVFAPGTTILESLRELARTPYDRILPARLYDPFAASLKLTFTRDGERDIPVTRGSSFNLVVTNTEKIRIQARPVRKKAAFLQLQAITEEAREVANLRLQAIASLPHLGVFSDEAHHTYGQSLGKELKRVRQTVDYLARETNVVCVINTTGTPYFERQPLKDVVVWYGLAQGIADGILKEVAGNIQSFGFTNDQTDEFVAHVIRDFFADYADVSLPDGSPAKLAIYFPQVADLEELRPHIEVALAHLGQPPTVVLANTVRSIAADVDAFNRLNDPGSPHRVILLVNKGTEGWNCPSLFSTALARKLSSANNFVLQAASRCLRQIPGNDRPARIYLSESNRAILDRQLSETYGESLAALDHRRRESKPDIIRLRKTDIPPIPIRRQRAIVARSARSEASADSQLRFTAPAHAAPGITRSVFDVGLFAASRRVLRQVEQVELEIGVDVVDAYAASTILASNQRLDVWPVLDALRAAYPDGEVPVVHLDGLGRQLEEQVVGYVVSQVEEESTLRIVKPEGWQEVEVDGLLVRQAEISYPIDKANLVWPTTKVSDNPGGYGFHYAPYNFDSSPEADLYERLLHELNLRRDEVEDVYFTGGITDPAKTDLVFQYTGRDGRAHDYTPDFVIHATGDRWMLIEVKMTARRDDSVEGKDGVKAKVLRDLTVRNPGRLFYRMVFADTAVGQQDVEALRGFLAEAP